MADPDARHELERAELETLWAHVPTGVVLIDAESREIVRMNPAAEQLLAPLGADAFSGRKSHRVLHADGRPYEREEWPMTRTLTRGETVRGEPVRIEAAEASPRTLSLTTAPIRERGRVVAAICLLSDVTEHERREHVAREFITNAAHELQTPIAAITSAIEVLQAGAKSRAGERDRFLLHIENATERLRRLTRALLVLSQAQARLEEPRREVVELEPFLRALAADVPNAAVEVVCDAQAAALANRELLEHAVASLLDNALKHAGTDIGVEAAVVGGRARITVRDAGRGISAADRARIFDRFFRSNDRVEGFGLGLAIVREVVDALSGELEVDSGEHGTRVSITVAGARVRRK